MGQKEFREEICVVEVDGEAIVEEVRHSFAFKVGH